MPMSKPIDEILAPKPTARPRIYAYSIADAAHKGQLKIGQTTRDVKKRVAEQLKTAAESSGEAETETDSSSTVSSTKAAAAAKTSTNSGVSATA